MFENFEMRIHRWLGSSQVTAVSEDQNVQIYIPTVVQKYSENIWPLVGRQPGEVEAVSEDQNVKASSLNSVLIIYISYIIYHIYFKSQSTEKYIIAIC